MPVPQPINFLVGWASCPPSCLWGGYPARPVACGVGILPAQFPVGGHLARHEKILTIVEFDKSKSIFSRDFNVTPHQPQKLSSDCVPTTLLKQMEKYNDAQNSMPFV
jgi:hypothetical protein